MEKRESGMIPAASPLYRCPEPAPTPDSGLFARHGKVFCSAGSPREEFSVRT